MPAFTYIGIIAVASAAVFAQSPAPEGSGVKFEIADVHPSPKPANQFSRITPPRNGRYEIRSASMVDLIRTAYDFAPDKVLGGPSWLEMDRFDIIAKVPPDTTPEALKPMLQSLLADRFKLAVHKDTKPLPTYALTAGKKPLMKRADGSGDTGCRLHTFDGPPVEGGLRIMMNGGAISLGAGNLIEYNCRNMTMEAFAAGMGNMLGANVGNNPVLDKTGLEGKWNFDVKWSLRINAAFPPGGDAAPPITVFEAVEKQLGLKLEPEQVPTPVLVVDSASETPTPNPPGAAEAFPEIPVPTAFEVADVKPTAPDFNGGGMSRIQNGRFTSQSTSVATLLRLAFSGGPGALSGIEFVNLPDWANTDRYDVTAKAPAGAPTDLFSVGPMLRSMLEDRFKLKAHVEERPQNAYTLVCVKPKMKKADPASRTNCKQSNAPTGSPPGTQIIACHNITMAQFVEQLRGRGPGLNWPVLDGTGLEGGWDFSVTFSNNNSLGGRGRGGDAGPATTDVGSASDPTGGLTIFEAVEKQLGLKLEQQKRPEPAVVIDHIEEKPTDN